MKRGVTLTYLIGEPALENKLREILTKEGYRVEPKPKSRHEVDIVAYKGGRTYVIEVEGNRKPKEEISLTNSQKYTHFLRAVGQLCLRMDIYPDCQYVLALPDDEYYLEKVSKTAVAFCKLGIYVYVLDQNGIKDKLTFGLSK